MDVIFTKHKDAFVAALKSALDLFYNTIDIHDLKKKKGANISETDEADYIKAKNNAETLERILKQYNENNTIEKEDEKYVVASLGMAAVHFDYLADCYSEAAKQAKIIIGNLKS